MTIGQIIKIEREKQGLTQREIAEIAGVSLATVKKWDAKNKPTEPRGMPLLKVMRKLSIAVDRFF